MAETWEDFGELAKEERYQRKSKLGKFFSFRTLKKFLKLIMYILVLFVYGLLIFRVCTGKPPKELSEILWTDSVHKAYTENGEEFLVYEQEPIEGIAKDGYFSVSDIRYIPSAKSFQLTVRYNNSSIEALEKVLIEKETVARREALKAEFPDLSSTAIEEKLTASLTDDPIVIEDLGETPFVFVLRDDYGNVYSEYSYTHDTKTVYQYMRISYENVPLFGDGVQVSPEKNYPTPEVSLPGYIYKGAHESDGGEIHYLYMDMYYANDVDVYSETFAYPLQVYTQTSDLIRYDYAEEVEGAPVTGLTYVNIPHDTNEK
jgi:hypothetical protein